MKTYKIILRTNKKTQSFICDGKNLDEAIRNAKSQLEDGERVLYSAGQLLWDWGNA